MGLSQGMILIDPVSLWAILMFFILFAPFPHVAGVLVP